MYTDKLKVHITPLGRAVNNFISIVKGLKKDTQTTRTLSILNNLHVNVQRLS